MESVTQYQSVVENLREPNEGAPNGEDAVKGSRAAGRGGGAGRVAAMLGELYGPVA